MSSLRVRHHHEPKDILAGIIGCIYCVQLIATVGNSSDKQEGDSRDKVAMTRQAAV